MKIKLAVFDLAGTTVKDNQDVHRVLKQSLDAHGVNISFEDANAVMGIPKPIAIEMLLKARYVGQKMIGDSWINEIHAAFIRNMIDFYLSDGAVGEKPGASETFLKLKEHGVKVFVDTGFDRAITEALLSRMGWRNNNLIDGSITSDEVIHGRPHPDMVYRAMELARVIDKKLVAKIGDTTSDLQEGFRAGCKFVIGVTSGAHDQETLEKEYHTHLIDNLPQVVDIVS